MKTMKYQPNTFLEVDDLRGQRKVVQVCKDGVTFWDALSIETTPLVIHEVMNPVELGTLSDFLGKYHLHESMRSVIDFMRRQLMGVTLDRDPLFIMRVMWNIKNQTSHVPGTATADGDIQSAIEEATRQAKQAQELHQYAEQYYSHSS